MSNLAATYIWEVNMLPPSGSKTSDWQEFLFACGTILEAKSMAFSLHPDWTIGTIESFVTRKVWTRK